MSLVVNYKSLSAVAIAVTVFVFGAEGARSADRRIGTPFFTNEKSPLV
jgi:hypothetical protein